MPSISTLILAAGASTRMKGKIKQLLPWKNSTLLGHAIQQAQEISDSIVVVLGAHADDIKNTVPQKVEIVHNPNWSQGMGGSISVGVRHIKEHGKNLTGLLIMLIDQPLLDAKYLHELKKQFEHGHHKIVATAYGEKLGVPAIFDSSLIPKLLKLNEDFGARHIIEEHKTQTATVFPEGKEIDIDTFKIYIQLTDF